MSDEGQSTPRGVRRHLWWAIPTFALIVVAIASTARARGFAEGATGTGVLDVTRESGGVVMVTLTPREFTDGQLTVEIGVTTHTVNDLDQYDLSRIITLDTGGEKIAPVSVPQLAGHHNTGELVFPLGKMPDSFSIEIRDLHEPGIRTFAWP